MAEATDAGADTLRLMGVRKAYGIGTPIEAEVLHDIDLTLRHGEFTALIGPSGSGKTTLLILSACWTSQRRGELSSPGKTLVR